MAEQLMSNLTKELQRPQNSPKSSFKSIYHVPKVLTDVDNKAYKPKLASFGPYHHNSRYLRPMEPHKLRALKQFHRRIARASRTPNDVLIAMRSVESDLISFHDALQVQVEEDALQIQVEEDDEEDLLEQGRFHRFDWVGNRDEFLKLMIVDGCFALEIMRVDVWGPTEYYDSHDPSFGCAKTDHIDDLKRDMLLVENQLPLLSLITLACMDNSGVEQVINLIKKFHEIDEPSLYLPDGKIYFHILDLYINIMTSVGEYKSVEIPSATKLRNVGISFCKSKTKSFSDIRFNDGILYLPQLKVNDNTESLLLNLMAFERLHATAGYEVTAYAFIMDDLIKTIDDITLFRNNDIINGSTGSENDLSNMFNHITKEMSLLVYSKEETKEKLNLMELNKYYKKRRHRWRASFVESYLKNPWVFISLLGGLLLLALTIIQAVYSTLQYYKA